MEKMLRYRKKPGTGRHSFRFGGKRYSLIPGVTVELPEGFLGTFESQYELLAGQKRTVKVETDEPGANEPPQKTLKLVKARGRGKFNIVNVDNPKKPLNDKPLAEEDALVLMGNLEQIVMPEEGDLDSLDWDQLVAVMETEGIDVYDEYETEDQLRQAIKAAR